MVASVIMWGDSVEEPRVLRQGLLMRTFGSFAEAEREANRLNVVAEKQGVPWRYWPALAPAGDRQ